MIADGSTRDAECPQLVGTQPEYERLGAIVDCETKPGHPHVNMASLHIGA